MISRFLPEDASDRFSMISCFFGRVNLPAKKTRDLWKGETRDASASGAG
jgi:hypothetical protein